MKFFNVNPVKVHACVTRLNTTSNSLSNVQETDLVSATIGYAQANRNLFAQLSHRQSVSKLIAGTYGQSNDRVLRKKLSGLHSELAQSALQSALNLNLVAADDVTQSVEVLGSKLDQLRTELALTTMKLQKPRVLRMFSSSQVLVSRFESQAKELEIETLRLLRSLDSATNAIADKTTAIQRKNSACGEQLQAITDLYDPALQDLETRLAALRR